MIGLASEGINGAGDRSRHEYRASINHTGHTILISGLDLAPGFDCEHGPLDAPDWIPAGYAQAGKHVSTVDCPPLPRSVARG